jgi:ABC-2 type transport system permease protein
MKDMLTALPSQLVDAMKFTIPDSSLAGFLAGYFYGFLILILPLIYTVIMADRMIAKLVDHGSMAFLLSTPTSRVKIALTQAVFFMSSIILLVVLLTIVGILACESMYPGMLDIPIFITINLGVILLYFSLSGIGFFASCLFNQSKYSLALGGGIPVLFFLLNLLSGVGEEVSGLKYLTLTTLFDPIAIILKSDSVVPTFIALFLIGWILYSLGIYIFSKKDLPM